MLLVSIVLAEKDSKRKDLRNLHCVGDLRLSIRTAPGHEVIEMALMRLHEIAKFFSSITIRQGDRSEK